MDLQNKLRLQILIREKIREYVITQYDYKNPEQWYSISESALNLIVKNIVDLVEREIDEHTG